MIRDALPRTAVMGLFAALLHFMPHGLRAQQGPVSREDVRAEVSPDGRSIAFVSRDVDQRNHGLFVIGIDGGGLRELTTDDSIFVKAPAWSPDGRRIAFSRGLGTEADVFVIDADGSNMLRLTHEPTDDAEPSWSPDGSELVFHSNRTGRYQLYRMDADGRNQRPLIESASNDYVPEWSGDGRIAFTSDRAGTQDVWVMNADGSGLRQLTFHPEREIAPVWSPDGSTVAFHRNVRAERGELDWNWDVYLVDARGGDSRRVTTSLGEDLFATWYPEGAQLLIPGQDSDGLFRLFAVDVGNPDEPRFQRVRTR